MKYFLAFSLIVMFAFSACEDEDMRQTCAVADPAANLGWLKTQVKELEASEFCQVVQQGNFRGQTVFVIKNCDPNVNSFHAVLDCDGNRICYSGDETCPNFEREVTNVEEVWHNQK